MTRCINCNTNNSIDGTERNCIKCLNDKLALLRGVVNRNKVNKKWDTVLTLLVRHGEVTTRLVEETLGIHCSNAGEILNKIVDQGLAIKISATPKRGGLKYRYILVVRGQPISM